MSIKNLLNGIDAIKRPVSARIVYVTEVETLKKGGRAGSKFAGQPIPSKFNGLKRIVTRVSNIGNDYTNAVVRQIEKGTGDPDKWQTDEHMWAEVDPAYPSGNVYQSRNHPDQKYIKIYEDMSSKVCEGGMFNGKGLVDVTWDELVAFCKKNPENSDSKKQERAGVAKQVKFRLVSAENVKYLRCGSFEYDVLSKTERQLLEDIS